MSNVGRPRLYSDKLVDRICKWISEGKSLHSFCRIEGNPSLRTVFKWLNDDEKQSFRVKYARACEIHKARYYG